MNDSDSEVVITSFAQGESVTYRISQDDTLTLSGITPNSSDEVIVDDDSAKVSIGTREASFYAADTTNPCSILYPENYQYERRGEDHVFYYTFTENICEEGN